MPDKREAAEKAWEQMNEKAAPAQRRSLQRLNEAFGVYREGLRADRRHRLRAALVLAAKEGCMCFVPAREMTADRMIPAYGMNTVAEPCYMICTSPEEAALCPEKVLGCMKLESVISRTVRDKGFAGLWLNPYGGHRFYISREDLSLYCAMAEMGVLDSGFHEACSDPEKTGEEGGGPEQYGEGIGTGTACILVCEEGIGEQTHPFWKWLREEGFHSWGRHGNYGLPWVFINLNSMEYAPGMPGIRITSPIRNHAVTMEEFKTIWKIFRKYDGYDPLRMPENGSGKQESVL